MDDVMALLASSSERFYQLRSRRHQRRQREAAWERLGQVRVDAQRLNVGQAARLLGVTAKVKHVGGRADRYQLVERNYSPAYLLPLPDNRAAAAGAIVQALQAEGPLLLVQYWLASGQPKITWIDMLRLEDTGRS